MQAERCQNYLILDVRTIGWYYISCLFSSEIRHCNFFPSEWLFYFDMFISIYQNIETTISAYQPFIISIVSKIDWFSEILASPALNSADVLALKCSACFETCVKSDEPAASPIKLPISWPWLSYMGNKTLALKAYTIKN